MSSWKAERVHGRPRESFGNGVVIYSRDPTTVAFHSGSTHSHVFVGDTEGNIVANRVDSTFDNPGFEAMDMMPSMRTRITAMKVTQKQLYAASKLGVSRELCFLMFFLFCF